MITGDLDARPCRDVEPVRCLRHLRAGGASDLGALLGDAMAQANALGPGAHVIALTDGRPSIGQIKGEVLARDAARDAASAQATLHTVAIGHAPDRDLLHEIARRGGGHALSFEPNERAAHHVGHILDRASAALVRGVRVSIVDGEVTDLHPAQPVNVAAGEHMAISGRLVGERATLEVRGTLDGRPWSRRVTIEKRDAVPDAIIPRQWARDQIEAMIHRGDARADVVHISRNVRRHEPVHVVSGAGE